VDTSRIGRSTVILILLALACVISAQTQPATGRTLLATVFGARNQTIVDLEADDFVIKESGQTREILAAHVADYPLVVVLDDSTAGQADLESVRAAAARFITRVGGERPIAVVTFGGSPVTLASFADDRTTVLERVRGLTTRAPGEPPALAPALAAAAALIKGLAVPCSAIVVVAGGATTSTSGAPTGFLTAILDSRAIVHVVEHRTGGGAGEAGDLRALAAQTRGQFTNIFSSASFQAALDHLADQMAAEMMIDYIVPGNAPPTQDVTVGIKLPGARVVGMGVR
jgi:hypothetical protein